MKMIDASYEILTPIDGKQILKNIELIGRTCYKSEDKIEDGSAEKFVGMLVRNGHEAMIEHESITVKFICDRGISHEIVRHRMASFAQESTRYANYSKDKFGNELTFIRPCWFESSYENIHQELTSYDSEMPINEEIWLWNCYQAEANYMSLLKRGWTPEQARSMLPNSLKTEIVMTANLREWRHFFKLRTDKAAHPQIRELAIPLLAKFKMLIPVVFDDIEVKNE